MLRGDVVIVSAQGDYGKPRPAVVVQNNRLLNQIDSVTVCFLTSKVIPTRNLRITIEPDDINGLRERSQVQIEKMMTFNRSKVRGPVGRLSMDQMRDIDRYLMIFLDLLPPVQLTGSS
jgi:mRNA interferase MazF